MKQKSREGKKRKKKRISDQSSLKSYRKKELAKHIQYSHGVQIKEIRLGNFSLTKKKKRVPWSRIMLSFRQDMSPVGMLQELFLSLMTSWKLEVSEHRCATCFVSSI